MYPCDRFRGGASNHAVALEKLLDVFKGSTGTQMKAIFFSDKQPLIQQECVQDLTKAVKDFGIEMFVVGTGAVMELTIMPGRSAYRKLLISLGRVIVNYIETKQVHLDLPRFRV